MTLSEYHRKLSRIKEEIKWKKEELSDTTDFRTTIEIHKEIKELQDEITELDGEFYGLEEYSELSSNDDGINDWNDSYEEEAIRRNK